MIFYLLLPEKILFTHTLSSFSFLENAKILVKEADCVKINVQHRRRNFMFAKNMQYLPGYCAYVSAN